MQFSLVEGLKTPPFPKGVGVCPACGNKTVSKCGSRKICHWAHGASQSCDPWWENETPWHRAWKSNWPINYQEVVHTCEITGERHIADVKNAEGIVIEFQNSPMNDEELTSREEFYRNMIWIVNGASFLKNFEFGAKLPNPAHPLSMDMCIRESNRRDFIYHLASENEPGASMVEIHGSHRIRDFVESTHDGHYLFTWKHPRNIWYRSKALVYFDFGEEIVWQLARFNSRSAHCLRAIAKSQFIATHGGITKMP